MPKKRTLTASESPLDGLGLSGGGSALARGLEILRKFQDHNNTLSVAELSSSLGLPRPTTARLVDTLVAHQFLREVPGTGYYQPAGSSFVIGQALLASKSIIHIAQPALQELTDRFGVHVVLGVRERLSMLCLDHCTSRDGSQFRYGAGALMPLASTALGRAWLWAQHGAAQADLIKQLRTHVIATTKNYIPGIYRAFQEMEEFGYCFSLGEWVPEIHAVAAPLALDDSSIYAVSCKATGTGFNEKRLHDDVGPALLGVISKIKDAAIRALPE